MINVLSVEKVSMYLTHARCLRTTEEETEAQRAYAVGLGLEIWSFLG